MALQLRIRINPTGGTLLPRRDALVLGHLADHVVEDAAMMEIRQLHVGVESHPDLKCFASVEL